MNCAVEFTAADFTGYNEAVRREGLIRRAACVSRTEIICGLEVLPLNAQHVSILTLTRSPFLCGYTTDELCTKPDIVEDINRFLWIISPMHCAGSKARKHWYQHKTPRDQFNEVFAPIVNAKVVDVVGQILSYIEDSFTDHEEGSKGVVQSFFSEEVSIAYEMSRYHGFRLDFWSPECPRDRNPLLVPLKIVFQLRKTRRYEEHGAEAVTNKSDRLIEQAIPTIGERFRKQHEKN